ncbi:hypothetical protein J1614_005821 [Plenodomus biglobosus]|nr:hypothetical protein J1614_005821 [Plenodomus biglobosus]
MGNWFSSENPLSAAAIEEMYAARAAAARARSEHNAKNPGEEEVKEESEKEQPTTNGLASDSDSNSTNANESRARNPLELQPNDAISIQRTAEGLRGSIPQNLAVSAACNITIAVRAYQAKASEALEHAIAELRKMGIINVAKVIISWIKEHPWETAVIAVPLILVACTPAILGGLGFGAGGIVAGSVAAGIQAGIGNVAAGSSFAILTSAMMGGGGLGSILMGIWGSCTTVMGVIAAWKRLCGSSGDGDNGADNSTRLAIKYNDEDG